MSGRLRTPSFLRWVFVTLLAALALVVGTFLFVEWSNPDRVVPASMVPPAPLAIVFGAGLGPQGEPSPLLAARVKTAVALYREGKAQRILLSGNSERHHDETRAMRKLAEASGLPE